MSLRQIANRIESPCKSFPFPSQRNTPADCTGCTSTRFGPFPSRHNDVQNGWASPCVLCQNMNGFSPIHLPVGPPSPAQRTPTSVASHEKTPPSSPPSIPGRGSLPKPRVTVTAHDPSATLNVSPTPPLSQNPCIYAMTDVMVWENRRLPQSDRGAMSDPPARGGMPRRFPSDPNMRV